MAIVPVAARADHAVTYLTDVEGQWERLASFLEDNPHAALVDGELTIRPGATMVFGGDAIDRGAHGRRIVQLLLDAKERQPDQLVLIAGNRDVNKLRLATELEGAPLRFVPDELKAGPRPDLLRWIFASTMGAAQAFEHRQQELAATGASASEDDVVGSFLDDLAPNGALTRYLAACQLCWRAGHTLFVHGGLAAEALTVVPGHDATSLRAFDVDAWSERLNRFYREQIDAFVARARRADGKPAWREIIRYQMPLPGTRSNPGSVVYGRFGDGDNNPTLPAPDVISALTASGVRRVVVGHTPNGDIASIVRSRGGTPFEVVIADNSRSRVDTACSLTVRDEAVQLRGRAVLDDGGESRVDATLPLLDRDSPVGQRAADGSLVKAPVDDGFHVFKYLPGYQLSQRVVAARALGPLHEASGHANDALDDDGSKG